MHIKVKPVQGIITIPEENTENNIYDGKVNVRQNQERFEYSGYLDKDTLRISLNHQGDICEMTDTNVIYHLGTDRKYKMVDYLK